MAWLGLTQLNCKSYFNPRKEYAVSYNGRHELGKIKPLTHLWEKLLLFQESPLNLRDVLSNIAPFDLKLASPLPSVPCLSTRAHLYLNFRKNYIFNRFCLFTVWNSTILGKDKTSESSLLNSKGNKIDFLPKTTNRCNTLILVFDKKPVIGFIPNLMWITYNLVFCLTVGEVSNFDPDSFVKCFLPNVAKCECSPMMGWHIDRLSGLISSSSSAKHGRGEREGGDREGEEGERESEREGERGGTNSALAPFTPIHLQRKEVKDEGRARKTKTIRKLKEGRLERD